jgi:formylglycine-generating enzyme required for sulfatase activity
MPSAKQLKFLTNAAILHARNRTDALFQAVRPEAWIKRPIPERHRILFYAGHLDAFDWNQVREAGVGVGPVDASLDRLFAFGIDPPPGQLPQDKPTDWPSIPQTLAYVSHVRNRIDRMIHDVPEEILHIILEHRLMHAETLTYMFHNLSYEDRILPRPRALIDTHFSGPTMVDIPAGTAVLGLDREDGFGWDNEFERNTCEVPAFRIRKYKVTNLEYLKFVHAGGSPPHYWFERGGEWFYRGMLCEMPLPANWPVYASHVQATEYARWVGKSLPSEAQFHRAASGVWGRRLLGNLDFRYPDAVPVTAIPGGNSEFGVSQLVGNGWEWTSTAFQPFSGFKPFPSYPGYSADFFDGDHFVLKGASPATDARLVRPSFRNWFRRHYPYAYTTFRLVEDPLG